MLPTDFRGRALPLGPTDIRDEAGRLRCSVAIIHAFSDLESGSGGGFLPDGRPKILVEARAFHLYTGGKWDRSDPNVSSPVWDRSLYGAGGAHQWERLARMLTLDRRAALMSCSVGRYQIMGSNFRMVGFSTVEDMWEAFCDREQAHLEAFGSYIRSAGLLDEMQASPPEFTQLAVGYNGTGEAANGYHQKLQVSWEHYERTGEGGVPSAIASIARTSAPELAPPSPVWAPGRLLVLGSVGPDVAELQRRLGVTVDQLFGGETLAAVVALQRARHLPPDGRVGPRTLAALPLATG